MAQKITYNGRHYYSASHFCRVHKIPYQLFLQRRREGVALEEIVRTKGYTKNGVFAYGKLYPSLTALAKEYHQNPTVLHKYIKEGWSVEEIIEGKHFLTVLFQGVHYPNIQTLLQNFDVSYEDYERYTEQGISLEAIIQGSYKEFDFYIQEDDVHLYTVEDFLKHFHVTMSWLKQQEAQGLTIQQLIQDRETLFIRVYNQYFTSIGCIALHYKQSTRELAYLLKHGYTIESALEKLLHIQKELQQVTGDKTIKNTKDYCAKYNVHYSSFRNYLRRGLSVAESVERSSNFTFVYGVYSNKKEPTTH